MNNRIYRTVSRTEEIDIMNIIYTFIFGIFFIPFTVIYWIVEAITGSFWLGIMLGLSPYIVGGIYVYYNYF